MQLTTGEDGTAQGTCQEKIGTGLGLDREMPALLSHHRSWLTLTEHDVVADDGPFSLMPMQNQSTYDLAGSMATR